MPETQTSPGVVIDVLQAVYDSMERAKKDHYPNRFPPVELVIQHNAMAKTFSMKGMCLYRGELYKRTIVLPYHVIQEYDGYAESLFFETAMEIVSSLDKEMEASL